MAALRINDAIQLLGPIPLVERDRIIRHEREWGGGVGAFRSDLHSDESLRLVTVAAHVVVQRTLGDALLAAELDPRDGALLVAFQ